MLTHERLKALLSYDPVTGEFRWNVNSGSRAKAGDLAGFVGGSRGGYRQIGIDGVTYYAHRLAFFYMTGAWPVHEIDHINGDSADNRFANLREATRLENMWNIGARSDSKLGVKGVYCRGNRFVAQIYINKQRVHLGTFDTPEAAHAAYVEAANDAFGEFARAA